MIKKLSLLLLCIGSHIMATPLEERLEQAVASHNPLKVSHLLKQLDRATPDTKKTQALIADLSQLAEDILDTKKDRVSICNNGIDGSMAFLGSVIGVFGLMYFGHTCYDAFQNYNPASRGSNSLPSILFWNYDSVAYNGSLSLAPGLWGAYFAYKGLTCSKQKEAIKRARMVQDILDAKREES